MNIELLGVSISIKTDEDPEYIKEIVDLYDSKIKELRISTNVKDNLKLAILSGILIADQYVKEKRSFNMKKISDLELENKGLILDIIETIDSKLLEIKLDEEEE